MPLTQEEKQQIINELDNLEREEINKVLSSRQSFLNWLKLILYAIYLILTKDPDILKKLFSFAVNYCI